MGFQVRKKKELCYIPVSQSPYAPHFWEMKQEIPFYVPALRQEH